MKTCSTCRFMATSRDDGGLTWFDSDYNEHTSDHATCVRVIHGNRGDQTDKTAKEPAVVVDGSGYAARLLVLPTFGCVLHEEKP